MHRSRLLVVAVLAASLCVPRAFAAEPRKPSYLTRHDLMTDLDAFYFRYVNPDPYLAKVDDWPIVRHVLALGGRIIDAGIIADRLNRALPVDEQPAFRHVKEMVNECARTLKIQTPPHLFIENDPHPNAFVTRLKEPHLLVLTSALYELYKDRPEELRFIIGHELGHLKCNHLRCHLVAHALVSFLTHGRENPSFAEDLLAHILVGQLLAWHRAAESSADRAGLLCVNGNLDIAKQALLRLQHGTKEDVIPRIAVREHLAFEREPFVKIMRNLRSSGTTHPFIPERCLALEEWTQTAAYRELVARTGIQPKQWLVIDEVQVKNLPDGDVTPFHTASDPIIRVAVGQQEFASGKFHDNNNPALARLDWKAPYYTNSPIILEVVDDDGTFGQDFIGACIIPVRSGADKGPRTASLSLRRDIKARSTATRLPDVIVKFHIEDEPKR